MKTKHQLEKNHMTYKEEKQQGELIIRYKIIRDVLASGHPKSSVAAKYKMHRNTVSNICNAFLKCLSGEEQTVLLQKRAPPLEVVLDLLKPLASITTKPHSNPNMASDEQTRAIRELFYDHKIAVGHKRMHLIIHRKLSSGGVSLHPDWDCLVKLTLAKLKGIYRREKLKVREVKTKHGESRPLYDYQAIGCFEFLHYDTKDIADQKALPQPIYELFKNNPRLPQVEWNIIDARSRFRFMAYSHNRSSEFGLHFLLFVICYLRMLNIRTGEPITIGMDNGSEFTSGSKDKLKQWNAILKLLQAEAYCYHPGHDVRKNLIERSHLTDDQEFFIPRGEYIQDQGSFLREARSYSTYYNYLRAHSGKAMNGQTPFELIRSKGIYQANALLKFPVLILEDSIGSTKSATQWLQFQLACEDAPSLDQKFFADMFATFPSLPISAQNVLTPHPFLVFFAKQDQPRVW